MNKLINSTIFNFLYEMELNVKNVIRKINTPLKE